ncbi:oligosaccharide flippase family protein [Agrilutibacter solisilvae]|uniref:Oligosaccharide flippase family protein n=1 Tax=Agrilutibacter solisilvae TaxID=2763317 RepID=A0A974Y4D3_9GAMM|nr:oligosaccharide flippase family protein [Lysobacter solisilvae]QSX77686.1 oligosaccharide flippase family protein [Lysobacter solisilvae]
MNEQAGLAQESIEGTVAPARLRPGIATHYLRYSFSNGMVMLAGFISFPILTRLLDNTQFGILRYYDTLMLLGVAILKLGTPHAIVRFYPYEGNAQQQRAFGTNMVLLPLMLSGVLWGLTVTGIALWSSTGGGSLSPLFWCALILIPMLAVTSIAQMVVRASERSDIVMTTRIVGRMLELVLVLGAVILVQQSALAVYGGKMIAAVLLLAWLAQWLYRHLQVSRDAVDLQALRNGLVYGLPLMAHEIAFSVLANMDRVLLKHLTDDFAAVGIYAIGYALAMQLNVFIDVTLSEAFTPVVMRAYETGGAGAVRALKRRVLLPMTYAVVAIVGMLLISGHDLLVALSGPGKAASGPVFIIVGVTISMYAWFAIANYGLQLKKRTLQVLAITLGAAMLNVVMNIILVPRMGYMGAAWSTAISYAALIAAQFATCPRGLARLPRARTVLLSLSCLALLLLVALGTDLFGLQNTWLRLCVAGLLFLGLYALPVVALDRELREMLTALRSSR